MSYSIILILLFILIIESTSTPTLIKAKGLQNISYFNSTSEPIDLILSFRIPVESNDPSTLKLNLSYPYRSNRTYCEADCTLNNDEQNNKYYDCEIKQSLCDLIGENKKIIIDSIIEPDNYEFENIKALASVINFEVDDLEMTCANYKLSFFLIDRNLDKNHPYEKINFEFPIYYKDKQETAKCIIPKDGIYIPCTIDASNRIFEKGYFINFEYNKSIELTEDLNLTLKLKKYVLEDDCGKDINFWKILYFSKYNFISLMLLFSFYLF